MIKACLLAASVTLALSVPAFAGDGDSTYVSAGFGAFTLNPAKHTPSRNEKYHFDKGSAWSLAIGKDFGIPRFEIEVSGRENSIADFGGWRAEGNYRTETLMLNAYADIENRSIITPSIGIGYGRASVSANGAVVFFPAPDGAAVMAGGSHTVSAYHASAGLAFELGEHVLIDVKYVYFFTRDPVLAMPVTNENIRTSYSGSEARAGIRYVF